MCSSFITISYVVKIGGGGRFQKICKGKKHVVDHHAKSGSRFGLS